MSTDISETVESERFQEILTLKKRVMETRDEIDRAEIAGRVRRQDALGLYQRKVREYVMGVETILDPADGEPSWYWTDEPIGDFTVPDGEHKYVNGLQEFLELPLTFEVEVEREQQRSYRHAAETVTTVKEVRPPERVIEEAFRATNRALDAAGFDIDEPTERSKSEFKNASDVEKAAIIREYLQSLSTDDLKEAKSEIDIIIAEKESDEDGTYE